MKYEAGFSWDSKQGKKVVVGPAIGRPDGWLMVTVDGTNFYIHEDDIEAEIAFDAKNLESHKRWVTEDNARREKEILARVEYNDVDGFDALCKTPMQAGRVLKVLNALVNYNGHMVLRKALIHEKVAEGWLVDDSDMTINGPDGRFLGIDGLTKTGIKYAQFLIEHGKQVEGLNMKTFELEFTGIYVGSDKNYSHEYKKHTLSVYAEDHKAAIAIIGRHSDYNQKPAHQPHVYKVNGRYVDHCGNFQTWQDDPKSDFEIRAAKKLRGERW